MDNAPTDISSWNDIGQMVEGGPLTIRVSGKCMEPLLKDKARVSVRRAQFYLPGDVVVVGRPSGPPVVHRLIGYFPAKGSLRYLTQADNSASPDGSVTREAIIGRVFGGDCSPTVFNVPFRHRARAFGRFTLCIGIHLKNRSWSLLKTS